MCSKHSSQHARSLDGKNSFVESLAIRKDAFSSESTSQKSCRVPVRKKFSRFSVGWNFETDIFLRKWITEQIDTTKSGEGIGLLKPAFSLAPKA